MSHNSPFFTEWSVLREAVRLVTDAAMVAGQLRFANQFAPAQYFNDALDATINDVKDFLKRHPSVEFNRRFPSNYLAQVNYGNGLPGVQNRCAFLLLVCGIVDSEFGRDAGIVAAVESALMLLQRRIEVLPAERAEWVKALDSGEINCERLGALRLLESDIWAFKAHGERQRTDLILQAAETVESESGRYALVLTEWKLASATNFDARTTEAIIQCQRYGSGVVGRTELQRHRYVILVSSEALTIKERRKVTDGVTYEIRNIVVNPGTPHSSAKAAVRAQGKAKPST